MTQAIESQQTSEAALSEAYQRYGRMVYNICRRMLDTPQDAEDATQAVFLIYLRKGQSLDPNTQLGGWFQRTATLVAREGVRSRMRRRKHEDIAREMASRSTEPGSGGADNDELWQELRPQLDNAIARLPEKYRTPLIQVYLAGQSQKDVAQALRLNEGTLRWRLSQAIETLRERLVDARYSAVLLLMLLESFGTAEPLPAHLLPSLLKTARAHSGSDRDPGSPEVSTSVTQFMQGGINALFWRRVKIWTAAGAGLVVAITLLAVTWTSHGKIATEESRGIATQVPKKDIETQSPSPASAAKPADAPEILEGLPIREVQITGVADAKVAAAARMVQSKKDQPFAQKTLDEDRQKLLESRKYSQVIATANRIGNEVSVAIALVEKDSPVSAFSSGPPQMITSQTPMLNGGRVVLYSRNRFGNYPLASYAFLRGLRGDDLRVRNDVDLVFGSANRPNGFKGQTVDEVPGSTFTIGACGMDGGAPCDRFRVSLHGGSAHTILDLGEVPYETATATGKQMRTADEYADVKVNHVYIIRIKTQGIKLPDEDSQKANCLIKLKVIQHNDNDGVMFDWEPLQPAANAQNDNEF